MPEVNYGATAETGSPFYMGIDKMVVRPNDILERRRRYLVRWTSIKAERSRQWQKWIDLTDYIMPERGRFLTTDHNKPKVTAKIMNNTPTRMARVLAAGLMSGCTPRARPWLELTIPDDDLAEYGPVKMWLWEYTRRMRKVMEMSGFYRAMSQGVYPDMATYGLGACMQEEDPIKVMRFIPLAIGSYGLAQDGEQEIDAILYEEPWTIGELVKEFGWGNVSNSVRVAWNAGSYEQYMVVLRVIEPNSEFVPGGFGRRGMKWGSVWMELGGLGSASGSLLQPSADPTIGFLREAGYQEFPLMCGRWATTARDVYPTGPGHDALPDAKGLMTLEKRSLLAVAKLVNPPMLIPDTMRLTRLSMLPGDPVYVPGGMMESIKPAQQVHHDGVQRTQETIRFYEDRIAAAFYADLMRRLVDKPESAGKQPVTAEEIAETKQEIMLQLGPVLDNVNDFLAKCVYRTHGMMDRRHLVPPAPREIRGQALVPRFISILFQAQKMIGVQVKERAIQFVGQMAQLKGQEATDCLDTDKTIDGYFDEIGLPPNCAVPLQARQQARAARAQKQQAMEQGQAMLAATEGAKNLSKAQTGSGDGQNLLARLLGPQAEAQAGGGA